MIDFNQIYNMAIEVVNSVAANRGSIEPNTTVCVIFTKSNRVFNGVSIGDIHAEVEAVRNMQGFGENAVDSIILVDALSGRAILPCFNCINMILSLNPYNADAMIIMPDRPVPFREMISQNPLGYNPMPQSRVLSRAETVSSVIITGKAKGDLLNSKINGLLAATKQEDSEEDLELLAELENDAKEKGNKKGLFGGLFGKK